MGKKNVFAGTGISSNDDAYKAGKEAAEMAISQLENHKPTFAFLFVNIKYENNFDKLISGIKSIIGNTPFIGTSTMAGECASEGWLDNSVSIMVLSSDYIHFSTGIGQNVSKNPKKAGVDAAKQAMKNLRMDRMLDSYVMFNAMRKASVNELTKMKPFFFITFIAGNTIKKPGREEEVLLGMQDIIGRFVPIFGGSSSDNWRLKKNYQFCNGKVYSDSLVTVAIASSLKIGASIKHGFVKKKKSVYVTNSEGHIVKTLNNKPAAEIWAKTMGVDLKKVMIGNPLKNSLDISMKKSFGMADFHGNVWLRVAKQPLKDGSMEFYPFVPLGTTLYLMEADKKKAELATKKAIEESRKEAGGDIGAVLVFSCSLRCLLITKEKEYEIISKSLKKVPFAGFSTEGEQGYLGYGPTGHHNITIVSIAFGNKLFGN